MAERTPRPVGLNVGDILTVREAARAMRMGEGEARKWLLQEGLICHILGRPRVLWGDVLARLRGIDGEPRVEPAPKVATRGTLRRASL